MHRFLHATAIWLLILGLAAFSIYEPHRSETQEIDGDDAASKAMWEGESLSSATEMRGRLLVLSQSMSGPAGALPLKELILGDEPFDQLASAILLASRGANAEATEQIDLAEKGFKEYDEAQDAAPLVEATRAAVNSWPMEGAVNSNGQVLSPNSAQFELLRERLGWFGEFAQARIAGDAQLTEQLRMDDMRFLVVLMIAALWFFGVGLCGLVALIVLGILGLSAKIRSGFAVQPSTSLILGETFVAWFVLFLALQFATMLMPIDHESPLRLVLTGAIMFASLGSLGWAKYRGLSFARIRDLAGLRWNGGFFRFLWQSAISYATALPLMGLGLLIGMAMGWLMDVPNLGNPSHPIQQLIDHADPLELCMLFALACIAAPIVEETIFRGLLYGHLRQGTATWGVLGSMLFSMVISGGLFAAIHPQGMFVAPALAGLACGFCITREWSGSVFPGMVAHGIQNATVIGLNVILFHA
ncbi:MAG: CPBP family intramembrane metalloprotease [Planctomycetes bacterium]|nr:CPBP family intramembrane metalloprotease [Planctomycetota bacterium]